MYLLLPLDQFTRYFQLHKAKYTNAAFVTFFKLLYFLQKRDWLLETNRTCPVEVPTPTPLSGEVKESWWEFKEVGRGCGGMKRHANCLKAELSGFPDTREKWELGAVVTVRLLSPRSWVRICFPLASCEVVASYQPSGNCSSCEMGSAHLTGNGSSHSLKSCYTPERSLCRNHHLYPTTTLWGNCFMKEKT